jgi:hypothetical protein
MFERALKSNDLRSKIAGHERSKIGGCNSSGRNFEMADDEDVSSVSGSDDEYEEQDLSDSDVVTKYRMAADIIEVAMQGVVTQLKADGSVVDACAFGDKVIEGQCAALFKNKKVEKGVAFPTCLSVNECVCHYSPLTSESGPAFKVGVLRMAICCSFLFLCRPAML